MAGLKAEVENYELEKKLNLQAPHLIGLYLFINSSYDVKQLLIPISQSSQKHQNTREKTIAQSIFTSIISKKSFHSP